MKMNKKLTGIILVMVMSFGSAAAPAVYAEGTQTAGDINGKVTADITAEGTSKADEQAAEAAIQFELAAEDAKTVKKAENTEVKKAADRKKELIAPECAGNLVTKAKGRGKTKIRWSAAEDADGYYVFRSTSRNGEYKVCKKITNGKKTKCVDRYRKLRKNRRYYYKVFAFKNDDGKTVISETAEKDSAKNTLCYRKKIKMKATAYSGGGYCANGKRCKVGRVAVDPNVVPLGTWLYVKGYGFCQACDTGGAIKGKRIDLYFNSEGRCSDYGVQSTDVYVLRK